MFDVPQRLRFFKAVHLVWILEASLSLLLLLFHLMASEGTEHQFQHTSPVAPFWTVAIRGQTGRQKRLFLIIGAFEFPAAARWRRQAFAIQLVKSVAIVRGVAFSVTRRAHESRRPFVEQ